MRKLHFSYSANMSPQNKYVKRLVSDANGRLADYKTGVEVLKTSASLRIEEVISFKGSTCLKDAQNSFENRTLLTSSTKKFLESGAVYTASNWSRYMSSRTNKNLEFLENCFNLVSDRAGNLITRATIEECYDSELRLRYFLCGRWKNVPHVRMTWLLKTPREGFKGSNVREGAYVLRRQTKGILTLSERLRQPAIEFGDEFFGWPFFKKLIVEMTQYYPEEEADLNIQVNDKLDLQMHYLITRLIGFSRLLHGFPEFKFRYVERAFTKRAIQEMIFKQGYQKQANISGVVPVNTLVKRILRPTTLTGNDNHSNILFSNAFINYL